MTVLAGDIGGTHTRLGLYDLSRGSPRALVREEYESRSEGSLAAVVRRFLGGVNHRPSRASFGVAGPVVDGVCEVTNLGWHLDQRTLAAEIGIRGTLLVNDFRALAHALPHLGPDDLAALQPGQPEAHGPLAVLGPGTGLGVAFAVWTGRGYQPCASEGGHADLASHGALEQELWSFLHQRYGHVSKERVLSGPGLEHVYRFLVERGGGGESPTVRQAIASGDPPAVIVEHAVRQSDPLCVQALDLFVDAFGARAGDLALTFRATGGVYLGGGIAPKILGRLQGGAFMDAFRRKGRLSSLLERVPVQVIVSPDAGLLGAAVVADQELG